MKKHILFALLTVTALKAMSALATTTCSTVDRFTPNGAEVTDKRTGLIWARCSSGQSWDGNSCTGTVGTYTHEQALSLTTVANTSSTGWRLPSVKELSSLADKACQSPALDTTVFPATVSGNYWSSSPYVGSTSYAWVVSFDNGYVSSSYRLSGLAVRLVRASQ